MEALASCIPNLLLLNTNTWDPGPFILISDKKEAKPLKRISPYFWGSLRTKSHRVTDFNPLLQKKGNWTPWKENRTLRRRGGSVPFLSLRQSMSGRSACLHASCSNAKWLSHGAGPSAPSGLTWRARGKEKSKTKKVQVMEKRHLSETAICALEWQWFN